MDVSIIIVTYNTKQLTENCINSIVAQTKNVSFEIILIDNDSTDGSDMLFSKDNRIKYIKNDQNLGFAQANNIAYSYASGKYLFLLNSDTLLLNNAIYLFYQYMEQAQPDVACVGTLLYDENGVYSQSYGNFVSIKSIYSSISRFLYPPRAIDCNLVNCPFDVECIIGADLFIKKKVVDSLGLFDEAFFMYHEENDFQKKLRNNHYRSMIISTPRIIHFGGKSGNLTRFDTHYYKSMFIYIHKWYSSFYYFRFRMLFLFCYIPFIICSHKNNKREFLFLIFTPINHLI